MRLVVEEGHSARNGGHPSSLEVKAEALGKSVSFLWPRRVPHHLECSEIKDNVFGPSMHEGVPNLIQIVTGCHPETSAQNKQWELMGSPCFALSRFCLKINRLELNELPRAKQIPTMQHEASVPLETSPSLNTAVTFPKH